MNWISSTLKNIFLSNILCKKFPKTQTIGFLLLLQNIIPMSNKARKKSRFFRRDFFLKLLAGAQVLIAIVGIVPIHVHLAVIEVHVRNIVIGVARTAFCLTSSESPAIFFKIT